MYKNSHELRDPIHVFVRLDSDERKVLNSRAFQRLRYIHQLALTYLVYPGATHRRFEHSLGVMELAGRVFDVVTRPEALSDAIRDLLPELTDPEKLPYWRRVLRMAALCHDLGHLPFSHAAERELLPTGWDHERLTIDFIRSEEMKAIWEAMTPPLRTEDVVKLAVGPKKLKGARFSSWEIILSEVIISDAFGVDRIDYLLRDSHHSGVSYGRFDHYRLIDTLRLLAYSPDGHEQPVEPFLGVEEGGLQSAEALLLARYFMYSQLYFHRVRRIYDIHLKDFLHDWLPGHQFTTSVEKLLSVTDNEVTAAMLKAAYDLKATGHDAARRIIRREHFRLLYQRHPEDVKVNLEAGQAIFEAAEKQFGGANVRHDRYPPKGGTSNFPVLMLDGSILPSITISDTLAKLPVLSIDYVFIEPKLAERAKAWLSSNKSAIIRPMEETNA
jgi:HD superfamily phosphohydrolase